MYRYVDWETSSTWYSWGSNSTGSSAWQYAWIYPPRQILVTCPEHWAEDDAIAFAKLVNVETHTGWLVTMIIQGEVVITDPNVETRTMAEFAPLLRWHASARDREKISAFFAEHLFEKGE